MTAGADIVDVAIIGGGFSGLMTLHHLVAAAGSGAAFTIIEPGEHVGRGLAYGTTNTHHLLNVPAHNMSALPGKSDHLLKWLQSESGREASASLGIDRAWQPGDYVPRCLFARYLDGFAEETFSLAKSKGLRVQHLRRKVADVSRLPSGLYQLALEGAGAVESKAVVLATGNLPSDDEELTDPWRSGWTVPKGDVAIIGTGLTTVDTILSLRDAGFKGKIIAASRHGLLPRVHQDTPDVYKNAAALPAAAPKKLAALIKIFRDEVRDGVSRNLSWQRVMDRWRPHNVAIWQKLDVKDRRRFLKRLYTLWNVHRHRMAPEIGAFIGAEIKNGGLKILHGGAKATPAPGGFELAAAGERHIVACVFDCRGPCPDVSRSGNTLISNLYRKGLIQRHETTWGLNVSGMKILPEGVDGSFLAIGPALVGDRLETIAVPELRHQALEAAQALALYLSDLKKEVPHVKNSNSSA